ncbi:hypothetical protein [Kitasatospora paracochleata]|uniref:Uncharacterized protein n=1 Tax=Kitasatospora paracochleata TaxID=58354 RepID=A0ABT1J951_9ACTN|nr:hypothetical protein [Kitasatospora paracochleata]MCP2313977.1 hypothetical protein [Kitasatospora paracochleata]
MVVAIRAARGGVANITGSDLAALRLEDPAAAVAALRTLGWQIDPAALLDSDPAVPVPVSVPDLGRGADHPLPFGKLMRTRVSGWTARTLNAKPVKKLPPAARLAALLHAAHGTAEGLGQVPAGLPGACRAAMADLESKGFIVDVTGDRFRLASQVGHLAGMRPLTEDERAKLPGALTEPQKPVSSRFHIEDHDWNRWKDSITPALRRHVEAVENCSLCSLARDRVAQAFLGPLCPPPRLYPRTMEAYGPWKAAHPDRGPQAAAFTVAFREKHGHGPSFNQLREGLGWELPRGLQVFVVRRLLANQWLISTGQMPWTLRPGPAAEAQGIALPSARGRVQLSHR